MPEELEMSDRTQRTFNRMFASAAFDDDVRYVMICHSCNTAIGRLRNSRYVKVARDPDQTLPCTCGGEFELVRDNRPD